MSEKTLEWIAASLERIAVALEARPFSMPTTRYVIPTCYHEWRIDTGGTVCTLWGTPSDGGTDMTTTALPLLATLKACPFCGGSAWIRNDGDWWSVCHGCKVAIGPCPEQTEAIAAWNRRAPAAEASAAMLLVLQQAEDEGLWCRAETATEAYLQQELRKLHAAIETVALAPAAEAASESWLRRQADLEDQCASVSAGAPAAAMDEAYYLAPLADAVNTIHREQGLTGIDRPHPCTPDFASVRSGIFKIVGALTAARQQPVVDVERIIDGFTAAMPNEWKGYRVGFEAGVQFLRAFFARQPQAEPWKPSTAGVCVSCGHARWRMNGTCDRCGDASRCQPQAAGYNYAGRCEVCGGATATADEHAVDCRRG